ATFGRQTDLQLIYVATIADGQLSRAVPAGLPAPEALALLLDGTGLTFEFLNARTIRIIPAPVTVPRTIAPPAPRHPDGHAGSNSLALEEVLVTATRREEPVSKVPIDMVVWTQEAMQAARVKGIEQIGTLTPGVDFSVRSGIDLYTDLS